MKRLLIESLLFAAQQALPITFWLLIAATWVISLEEVSWWWIAPTLTTLFIYNVLGFLLKFAGGQGERDDDLTQQYYTRNGLLFWFTVFTTIIVIGILNQH